MPEPQLRPDLIPEQPFFPTLYAPDDEPAASVDVQFSVELLTAESAERLLEELRDADRRLWIGVLRPLDSPPQPKAGAKPAETLTTEEQSPTDSPTPKPEAERPPKTIPHASTVYGCVRFLHRELYRGKEPLSSEQITGIATTRPDVQEAGARGHRAYRLGPSSALAAFFWLKQWENPEALETAIAVLSGKQPATTDHPFAKLRELLLSKKPQAEAETKIDILRLIWGYLESAWEKHLAGKSVAVLRPLPIDDRFPCCDAASAELAAIFN